MLGSYNQHDQTMADAQMVGDLLDQVRSYAVNPEPQLCPAINGVQQTYNINEYALFIPSDPGSGGANFTSPPDPNNSGNITYQCGIYNQPTALTTNEYAVEAIYFDTSTSTRYTLGVVSIGHLSNASVFDSPGPSNLQSSNPRATLIGWQSPSGIFDPDQCTTYSHISPYNYFVQGIPFFLCVGGTTTSYEPNASINEIITENTVYSLITGGLADGQYMVISVGSSASQSAYRVPIVINMTTGVTVGIGKLPDGFQILSG